MKLCFYACTVFACIGYREVMHGGTHWTDCCGLGLTSFPDCHGKPRQRPGNENNLPRIGVLFTHSTQQAAHGDAGGEACTEVLVISADVKP